MTIYATIAPRTAHNSHYTESIRAGILARDAAEREDHADTEMIAHKIVSIPGAIGRPAKHVAVFTYPDKITQTYSVENSRVMITNVVATNQLLEAGGRIKQWTYHRNIGE